jgi:hypothetical protein
MAIESSGKFVGKNYWEFGAKLVFWMTPSNQKSANFPKSGMELL